MRLRHVLVSIVLGACHAPHAVTVPVVDAAAYVAISPVARHATRQDYSDDPTVKPLAEVITTGHEACAETPTPVVFVRGGMGPQEPVVPNRRLLIAHDLRPCADRRRPVPMPLY